MRFTAISRCSVINRHYSCLIVKSTQLIIDRDLVMYLHTNESISKVTPRNKKMLFYAVKSDPDLR
jgi:hypothetical protein